MFKACTIQSNDAMLKQIKNVTIFLLNSKRRMRVMAFDDFID